MSRTLSSAAQCGRQAAAWLLLTATGCYTTHNVATLSPLDTQYPVSASGQYVDSGGNVVAESGYTVVRPFELEKTIDGPRHESTYSELDLKPELDRMLQQSGGDAITNLRIQAVNYDAGSHRNSAGWKMMGWTLGLTGGTLLVAGAASHDQHGRDILLPMGGVTVGLAVLSFVGAVAAHQPSQWQFRVSGQVVRSNAPPPAEPQAPPGNVQAPVTPPAPAPAPAPAQ